MYYTNHPNNRSIYHINFFDNNKGYQTYVVENILQYVYHTVNRARSISLYRKATKYFKIKNMRVSYHSYYNLRRVANDIFASNDSIYGLARKYGTRSSIFSYSVSSKRMSFSDIVHRYDHRITQTEDFNIYETTFNL